MEEKVLGGKSPIPLGEIRPDVLYTLAETARALRLGESTLRMWALTGKLPTVRLGRRRLVRGETILKMVEEGIS